MLVKIKNKKSIKALNIKKCNALKNVTQNKY